jgi:hypothetical protein
MKQRGEFRDVFGVERCELGLAQVLADPLGVLLHVLIRSQHLRWFP